jgi:hypothetical protein
VLSLSLTTYKMAMQLIANQMCEVFNSLPTRQQKVDYMLNTMNPFMVGTIIPNLDSANSQHRALLLGMKYLAEGLMLQEPNNAELVARLAIMKQAAEDKLALE